MATRNSMRLFGTRLVELVERKKFEHLTEDRKNIARVMKENDTNWSKELKKIKKLFVEDRERNVKSESKAKEAVAEGEVLLKHKDYESALKKFSQAIRFVPTKHLLLAKAYEGRCFAHMMLKEYQCSLEDADRALKVASDNQKNLIYTLKASQVLCLVLLKRIGKAKQLIRELTSDENFVNLIGKEDAEKFLKSFEDLEANEFEAGEDKFEELYYKNRKVEIKHDNNNGGRFIVATHDIKQNEFIAKEVAVVHCIYDKCFLEFCIHCFKKIKNTFIPCERCSQVVFCDEVCRKKAWNNYHQYECQVADFPGYFNTNAIIAYRIVLLLGGRNCIKFQKGQFDAIKNVSEDNLKSYETVSSLMTHRDKLSSDQLCSITEKCIQLTCILYCVNLLQPRKGILKKFDRRNKLEKMCSILIDHLLRSNINAFGAFQTTGDQEKEHIGSNMFPFCTCFNHSCDPNARWKTKGNRISVWARKDIAAGEEVTISYGPVKWQSLEERQERLERVYFFTCQCSACLRDQKLGNRTVILKMLDDVLNSQP